LVEMLGRIRVEVELTIAGGVEEGHSPPFPYKQHIPR
jgi:hypothetical protein